MIEFITNNWFYILIVGLMIFSMSRGGGCCGSGNSNNLPGKDQEAIDDNVKDPMLYKKVDSID